jgi:hypothetical protein
MRSVASERQQQSAIREELLEQRRRQVGVLRLESIRGQRHTPRQKAVVKAFLWAWEGYSKWAWGRDELLPVSKGGKDWLEAMDAASVDGGGDEEDDDEDDEEEASGADALPDALPGGGAASSAGSKIASSAGPVGTSTKTLLPSLPLTSASVGLTLVDSLVSQWFQMLQLAQSVYWLLSGMVHTPVFFHLHIVTYILSGHHAHHGYTHYTHTVLTIHILYSL